MARKIQHKRGLEVNLPQLDEAEIAFTTDSKKPFIGSADGNVEIAKKKDVDEALANKANATTVQGLSQTVTTLNTEVETKADTETVNTLSTQLAQKAKVDYFFLNLLQSGQITDIKLIGDSITVGVGAGGAEDTSRSQIGVTGKYEANISTDVWANYLRRYINNNYPSITFFNAGIGGWSATSEGLTFGTDWYGTNNDFVFVMLGTNDRGDATTESEFETNLTTVLKDIEANSNHMIVMTAPPTLNDFDEAGIKNPALNLTMEQIDKVISKVCAKQGFKHISFYREFLKYQSDTQTRLEYLLETNGGSHPIQAGYNLMWKVLQQSLGLITNTHDWKNLNIDTKTTHVLSESGSLYGANEPISSFEVNSINVLAIANGYAEVSSMPEGKGGTLTIVRPYNDSFAYREYVVYQTGNKYVSYWLGSGWSSWNDNKSIISASGGSIMNSTTISSFPANQVSYWAIATNHPDIANFPSRSGGVLKTVRTYSDSYSYQEFITNTVQTLVFKRYWRGSAWSNWVGASNLKGSSGARPPYAPTGTPYFDETLGKPIWFNGTSWVDSTGTVV